MTNNQQNLHLALVTVKNSDSYRQALASPFSSKGFKINNLMNKLHNSIDESDKTKYLADLLEAIK